MLCRSGFRSSQGSLLCLGFTILLSTHLKIKRLLFIFVDFVFILLRNQETNANEIHGSRATKKVPTMCMSKCKIFKEFQDQDDIRILISYPTAGLKIGPDRVKLEPCRQRELHTVE